MAALPHPPPSSSPEALNPGHSIILSPWLGLRTSLKRLCLLNCHPQPVCSSTGGFACPSDSGCPLSFTPGAPQSLAFCTLSCQDTLSLLAICHYSACICLCLHPTSPKAPQSLTPIYFIPHLFSSAPVTAWQINQCSRGGCQCRLSPDSYAIWL